MKVIHINSTSEFGGLESYLVVLSKGCLERGHNIKLICHPKGKTREIAEKEGVPTISLLMKKYIDLKAVFALSSIFKKEKPQIIHSHNPSDLWLIVPATCLSKTNPKIVLHKHIGCEYNKRDVFHSFIYKKVDKIVAISEHIKRDILRTHPVGEEKVVIIYNGIDLKRYNPKEYSNIELKREFKIKKDTKIVGIVGRLDPGKGQKELLYAAKILLKRYSGKLMFMIVGEDIGAFGHKRYLIELANGLGLPCIFTGHRDDIPKLMRGFDIFVFTSKAEAFGLVLIEASAMEIPIVAFKGGAVPEIVKDGVNGIIVNQKDVEKLASAILFLLNNPKKGEAMGRNGREIVKKRFSLDIAIKNTEILYEALILNNEKI